MLNFEMPDRRQWWRRNGAIALNCAVIGLIVLAVMGIPRALYKIHIEQAAGRTYVVKESRMSGEVCILKADPHLRELMAEFGC